MIPDLTTPVHSLALVAVAAYLLGSIPFGVIIARIFGLGNLREIGSGNIGATNVLRTGNKLAAGLTLVFDAAKAGVAIIVARSIFAEDAAQTAGFFAFLGHLFPVWLRFNGGKGVATFVGTVLALSVPLGALCCGTWLAVAYFFRMSSLAALIASASGPIWAWLIGYEAAILLLILLAVLIYIRHSENIRRIFAGEETRIGERK